MPRFSLVVATKGRTEELQRLFESLITQSSQNYEIIVVDQNEDDRIDPYVRKMASHVPCFRTSHAPGVSGARNHGLESAVGDIVAFPDDDCWYSKDLLQHVDGWFQENPRYAVLAVGAQDEAEIPSGNRWIQDACDIRPVNSLRTTFCSSLFVRRLAIPADVRFDESLSCGEETDFILTLLKSGQRGRFDRTWHVYHPRRDMLSGTVSGERAFSYGAGMGYLTRRHSMFVLWMCLLAYDLARAAAVTIRGRFPAASRCLSHTRGLFSGYVRG